MINGKLFQKISFNLMIKHNISIQYQKISDFMERDLSNFYHIKYIIRNNYANLELIHFTYK